jgi:hypothetical protein
MCRRGFPEGGRPISTSSVTQLSPDVQSLLLVKLIFIPKLYPDFYY